MAAVTLHLSLDQEANELRGGDTVEGTLEASVQDACECRGISVRLSWNARSRYEKDEGHLPEIVVHSGGALQPGELISRRFALQLPPAAWTYQGSTFSLTYEIQAKADLVNQADASDQIAVTLIPSEHLTPESLASSLGMIQQSVIRPVKPLVAQRSKVVDSFGQKYRSGCLIVFGLISLAISIPFIVASLYLAGIAAALFQQIGWGAVLPLLVWTVLGVGIPLIAGLGMLYLGARPFLVRWLIGEVTVDAPERLIAPGDTLRFNVRFHPRHEAEIQGVTATLRARETVWRSGKESRTAVHQTIRSEARTLEGPRRVQAHDDVELTGRTIVPKDAPLSLGAPNHWVVWHLVIHVALRGWIDYQSEHIITVAPLSQEHQSD